MSGRCTTACVTDECNCSTAKPHVHAVDAMVNGKLTRSIITPEWRARMLAEPDDIGGEPVLGESV